MFKNELQKAPESVLEALELFLEILFVVRFDSLRLSQQYFSYVRTCLPGLNQY